VSKIMRSPAFARGVSDQRTGRAPRDFFADTNAAWDYQRGRQWAVAVPRAMPVMDGRKVNRKAIRIYERSNIP
jgi:hypothetical protein